MAYIGNSPANVGNYQIVDDISSSFNGSLTSFALTSGSIAITPAKSGQLLVGVNGVMQEPDDTGANGFKVSGSNVVFSSPPANGDTFWAIYQGQNVDIGTPSNDVVDTVHIKDGAITGAKIASGTVVVGPDSGGPTDLIEHGKTGLLIDTADSHLLLHSIYTLLEHPSRDLMQIAARKSVQHRTWEYINESLIEHYRDVIELVASRKDLVA